MIYPHPQILFIIDPNFNGFTYSPHFAQNMNYPILFIVNFVSLTLISNYKKNPLSYL